MLTQRARHVGPRSRLDLKLQYARDIFVQSTCGFPFSSGEYH